MLITSLNHIMIPTDDSTSNSSTIRPDGTLALADATLSLELSVSRRHRRSVRWSCSVLLFVDKWSVNVKYNQYLHYQ